MRIFPYDNKPNSSGYQIRGSGICVAFVYHKGSTELFLEAKFTVFGLGLKFLPFLHRQMADGSATNTGVSLFSSFMRLPLV